MLTFIGTAYVHGVIWGVTKKVTELFNRNLFLANQHEFAEKTVGRLHECNPIESVFSKDAINKFRLMIETGDFRGMLKVARDESVTSDKPWCVSYVIAALDSLSMCLPDIVYKTTVAYIYGKL
jgi:hypothetical protein